MRRAADLYPGEAKTDKRDAFIIADTGRTRRKQVHFLDVGRDDLLDRLRVLNGFGIDLAADQTRLANRCRDALTSVSPALERALGARLNQAGIRVLLAKYPSARAINWKSLEQWQYEVTAGGRLWYRIDDAKRTVWLTDETPGHPFGGTEARRENTVRRAPTQMNIVRH